MDFLCVFDVRITSISRKLKSQGGLRTYHLVRKTSLVHKAVDFGLNQICPLIAIIAF